MALMEVVVMNDTQPQLLLIGDVGGTNIRLRLLPDAPAVSSVPAIFAADYKTKDFNHLHEALDRFFEEAAAAHTATERCAFACLAVCGPVVRGRAVCLAPSMGEDGWILDEVELAAHVPQLPPSHLKMINDFIAVGTAIPEVGPELIHTIHAGQPQLHAPFVCIGPGTGLGNVYCTWELGTEGGGAKLRVHPSEGGMSDFVPRTEEEWQLRRHIAQAKGLTHVEVRCSVAAAPPHAR